MAFRGRLRDWLGVTEPVDYSQKFKDMQKIIDGWDKEFWTHRQLLKERCRASCPVCMNSIMLWPLGTESYYMRDGEAYHLKCYDKRKKIEG